MKANLKGKERMEKESLQFGMAIVTEGSLSGGKRKGREYPGRAGESLLVIGKIIGLFIIKSDGFIIVL